MGVHGSKELKVMPPEELSQLVKCTHFNRNELKKWYRGFIKDCPDGELDHKQFIDLYNKFFEGGNPSKFAGHVFRTFDVNDDHKIDFREFISSISVVTRGSVEEKLGWAFKIYDVDGNGYVSLDEIIKILESIHKMAGVITGEDEYDVTKIVEIFEKMDTDKNGFLTLDEFIHGAEEDLTFVKMLQAKRLETLCKEKPEPEKQHRKERSEYSAR